MNQPTKSSSPFLVEPEILEQYTLRQSRYKYVRNISDQIESVSYTPGSSLLFWYNSAMSSYEPHWHSAMEMIIPVEDFCYAGNEVVTLEIANGGNIPFDYAIRCVDAMPDWLQIKPTSGTVTTQNFVDLCCDRSKLKSETESCTLHITDGRGTVAVRVSGRAADTRGLPGMTFVQNRGVISMLAEHYAAKQDVPGAAYGRIADYGKYGSGMKVLPSTAAFTAEAPKPTLTYSFLIEEAGDYSVELLTAPNNPVQIGSSVSILLGQEVLELIPANFRAGESSDPLWSAGVLNQIHTAKTKMHFDAGVQTLTIGAMDPGVVVEKILIYQTAPLPSYLGPEETVFTPAE